MKLRAIRDNILCTDGDFGDKVTDSGLIIKSTIGKAEGITPRWFKVFEVGPEIDWCKPGQWLFVEYGRWTEAMTVEDDRFDSPDKRNKIWKVDPKGCIVISDEEPDLKTITFNSEAVGAMKKTLY